MNNLEETVKKSLDVLYQPEIVDLELNEYQGISKPVIYLDQAKNTVVRDIQIYLENMKEFGENT